MVAELIGAGCSPEVAAQVVARAFVAGSCSAEFRGIPPDSAAEKRRAYDRERKRKSTGIPPESTGIPNVPLSTNSNIKKRERQNRGTRIAPDWSPSDAEKAFARQEGYSEFEVHREINKFRDYWTACAGAKGVKLDWSATWRQWVRNGAERAGKTPAAQVGSVAASGFYAKADSAQLAAWDAHARKSGGKLPRDKNGGWRVQSEWPPNYIPPEGLERLSFELKKGLAP